MYEIFSVSFCNVESSRRHKKISKVLIGYVCIMSALMCERVKLPDCYVVALYYPAGNPCVAVSSLFLFFCFFCSGEVYL